MKTQFINLNMTPSGINPTFHIAQYDVGRLLGFYVYNGSEVVDLDDYTCTVEATRTDGTQITADVITTDNQGVFVVTAEMSNEADKYNGQLVIIDSNANRIASLPFIMDVITAALNGNAESISEDRTLYQQYNAAMQAALANEATARANADDLEKVARQSDVNTLQNNIDAEATARANAITAEATARTNADATLQDNINAEAIARQSADTTLQGNIDAESAARTSADNLLDSRIDQIVAPSGEAPSAAEVTDARIGTDNTIYGSLGTAIRTQVGNLKSAISSEWDTLGDTSENLMPAMATSAEVNGVNVAYSNGKFVFIGTASATGGSNVKLLEFELSAGTYTVSRDTTLTNITPRFYYGSSYVSITLDGNSFTINSKTACYVSVNLIAETVYGAAEVEIMLVTGSTKKGYVAPIVCAKDTVARTANAGTNERVALIADTSDNLMPYEHYTNSVNSVDVNYGNGELVFSGTASATGGRKTKLTEVFTLAAGTYNISCTLKPANVTPYIETAEDDTNITVINVDGANFTLNAETEVYIGANVVSGVTYNGARLKVMLTSGSGKRRYQPVLKGATVPKSWEGLVWVCVGDSLTEENSATTKHYFDYIADKTGISIINMGDGGTGYAKGFENNEAFYQRITADMPSSNVDVVTIFGSGNDLNNNGLPGSGWTAQLGTPADQTADTLCGCMNLAIDAVYTKLPLVRLGIVLPTPWASSWNADAHRLGNTEDTVTTLKKWGTYCNALKQICINRGIPYLDLYHESSLRPWEESYRLLCYSKDTGQDGNPAGTHPDETGHAIIAPLFKSLLTDIMRRD